MENKSLRLIDLTTEEILYLYSFIKTIKHFNVPDHTYHYGSYAEQCICINKNDENMWEVYIVERGKIHNKKTFETFFDACLESIDYVSRTKDEHKEMIKYYKKVVGEIHNNLNQREKEDFIPRLSNSFLEIKKLKK